jgi:hypothetical protein
MKINSYDFDIFYKNGKKHANADAMSRLESVEVNALGWKGETSEAEERRFRFMQKQDKFCVPILRIRDKGGKELQEGFLVENGLLYHREGNREDGSTTVQLVVWGGGEPITE